MKPKYLIGTILILVFVGIAIYTLDESKIIYSDIEKAQTSGEIVQIIGSWVKDQDLNYDSENNKLTFNMVDEKQNKFKVIYSGAKPNNFDIAPMIVVKGVYEGDVFKANQILTKCPSKYEGTVEELKNS